MNANEDEKRLAEIRKEVARSRDLAGCGCNACDDLPFVLDMLDEEKRARKAAESVVRDALARLGEADVALAEEKAKRIAAEECADVAEIRQAEEQVAKMEWMRRVEIAEARIKELLKP